MHTCGTGWRVLDCRGHKILLPFPRPLPYTFISSRRLCISMHYLFYYYFIYCFPVLCFRCYPVGPGTLVEPEEGLGKPSLQAVDQTCRGQPLPSEEHADRGSLWAWCGWVAPHGQCQWSCIVGQPASVHPTTAVMGRNPCIFGDRK